MVVVSASGSRPASLARTGRTKTWKLTNELTGFPGSAISGTSSPEPRVSVPNPWGFPGCIATLTNCTRGESRDWRTTSKAPAEIPPEVTTRSAASTARAIAARNSGGLSETRSARVTSPPHSSTSAASITRFESGMAPGRSTSPGTESSFPVERIATRGRGTTLSSPWPTAPAAARAAGVMTVPSANTEVPMETASPWNRT